MKKFLGIILMLWAWIWFIMSLILVVEWLERYKFDTQKAVVVSINDDSPYSVWDCKYYPIVTRVSDDTWEKISLAEDDCYEKNSIKIWQKLNIRYDQETMNWRSAKNLDSGILFRGFFTLIFWYLLFLWFSMTRTEKNI